MANLDIIQKSIAPTRVGFTKKVFDNLIPSPFRSNLIEEDNETITINTRPFDMQKAMEYLGSKQKVNAMFIKFSWSGGVVFRKFFLFEFIKILEDLKRRKNIRYGVDISTVNRCLEYFTGDLDKIETLEDLDRKRINNIFNFEILAHQEQIIKQYLKFKYIQKYRGMLMHAAAGVGKALAHGTPIRVIDGWKNIEDLHIGDIIVGANGRETKVTGVFPQGLRNCYSIIFNDGREIIADEEHLWKVNKVTNNIESSRWELMTTKEIIEFSKQNKDPNVFLSIPKVIPEKKSDKTYIIDPYILGSILQKGYVKNNILHIDGITKYVMNNIIKSLHSDMKIQYEYRRDSLCYIKFIPSKKDIYIEELKKYDVLNIRNIPIKYMNGSTKQKNRLLKSLIDNRKDTNTAVLSTDYDILAKDMIELIRSLGGVCSIIKNDEGDFNIDYNFNRHLYISNIRSIGKREASCISVDNKDKLYVARDYIVTHNTATSLFIMEGLHHEVDKVIIICPLPTVSDVWVKSLGQENNVFKQAQDYWWIGDSKPYDGQKYIICHYDGLDKLHTLKKHIPMYNTGVIIDECHNLNDPKSKRTMLAVDFINNIASQNVLMLSGTPLKSGFREMSLMFKLLDKNFDRVAERRYLDLYKSPTKFLAGVLRERYDGYAIKVTKDAIELDPLNTVNLKVTIPEEEMKQYYLSNIKEDLRTYVRNRLLELKSQEEYWTSKYIELRDEAIAVGNIKGKELLTYYRDVETIRKARSVAFGQLADTVVSVNKFENQILIPQLDTSEKRKLFKEAKTIYKYPTLKVQGEALANVIGKARINCHIALAEYLDFRAIINSTSKKTIVFSNYIDVCKAAENICKQLGYNPICVFGEETKNLASNVDKFLNSKTINPLITTYKSLSTGVPLIAADTIICLDMPFRMYIYEQAVSRAWRLGQDSQVTSYIIEANTEVPNINSRNIDIITWYKEEVERITGIPASVGLKGETPDENVTVEDVDITNTGLRFGIEDLELSEEGFFGFGGSKHKEPTYKSSLHIPYIDNDNSIYDPKGYEYKIQDFYNIIFSPEDHYDSGIMGHIRIRDDANGNLNKFKQEVKRSFDFTFKRIKEAERSISDKKCYKEPYTTDSPDNMLDKLTLSDKDLYISVYESMDEDFEGQEDTPEYKSVMDMIEKEKDKLIKEYNKVVMKLVKTIKKEENVSTEDMSYELSTEANDPKRKTIEDFIIKYIGKIATGEHNVNLYRELFRRMNNEEFKKFMEDLRDGKKHLTIIIPNGMKEIKTDMGNNMKIAKELGFEFYQRLKITGSSSIPDYITPNKYLVIKLPVKRASQLLSKKISIPRDNKSRDLLTGQVTGDSKAAKLTNPEVQILLGLGLENSIKELMKFRGGDLGAGTAMNNDIIRYGQASQQMAARHSTGVVSTKTLKQFFQAMHIRTTL